jgi:CRISPR-associated protein cas5, dvulg subtype
LEAVFWHPGLRWRVDRICVLSKIRFTNVRRNELKAKIPARTVLAFARNGQGEPCQSTKEDIQQRAATILQEPHYIIEAHFEMTEKASAADNEGKFREMFCRRARKGQCYHAPYLGCREFPARFRLYEEETLPPTNGETKDLGFMLYDIDYSDPKNLQPMFFQAQLVDGVLDLRDCEVLR